MTTNQIENLKNEIEAIEKHARIEALKKVRTRLEDKAERLDRILESKEAMSIVYNSFGNNYRKLAEKRRTLKIKYYTTWDIISKINDEISEEYNK